MLEATVPPARIPTGPPWLPLLERFPVVAWSKMGRDYFPPQGQQMTIDEIIAVAKQLKRANDGTADHSTAMVNAVGLVLGLYAWERAGKAQYIESNMIAANAYDFHWHQSKLPRHLPDRDGYGLDALYRLYRAKSGWVFLACPFE